MKDGIDQQNIAVFETRLAPKMNLPAFVASELNVANVGMHEVAHHAPRDAAYQISGKNEGIIEHDDHVQRPACIIARNRPANGSDAGRQLLRRIDGIETVRQISSSMSTSPVRVEALGATSAATAIPRAHTNDPALVRTGQVALRSTQMWFTRKKCFSL